MTNQTDPLRAVTFEDVQCGRCGSSMSWEDCDGCDGGLYEDEGDWDEEPALRTCPACGGKGGWWVCLSDWKDTPGEGTTWCERNPRPGREGVPCSAREDFAVYSDGTTAITGRSWTDDLSELGGQGGVGTALDAPLPDRGQSGTAVPDATPSGTSLSDQPPAYPSGPFGDVGDDGQEGTSDPSLAGVSLPDRRSKDATNTIVADSP